MRKIVYIIVLAFLIAGCGSLKQGWNNFTAYYNTFYNAKKFYNAGLEKNQNQVPDLNPLQPIRIHPAPTNAGLEDFELAIEKGSGILLNHEDSKFVVPALFIIGKSYYYRSEFFAALEKFQELNTLASGEQRQEAVMWLGLTYLEMSNFNQGIETLDYELENIENWSPEWRAKVQLVLAELHVELENWDNAAQFIENALSEIEDQDMRARSHFLLGQIYEEMGDLSRALFSYNQINNLRTDFDIEFNAVRKQAEMSRLTGSYDYAASLYRKLRRDDKFIEYRPELKYEIARTLQLKGDEAAAIQNYNDVLHEDAQPTSNITLAKAYYGLGEIYRDQQKNLRLAAAYFDSAASQRVDQNQIAGDFDNADELADSFGEYVNVKQSIAEKDSLLNLAQMEPEELERFIEELQQKKMQEMEEELERIREQRDQMLVVDEDQEPVQAVESTEYGFLNIESPTRLADASLQFQAVWGDRPLADNWRRRAAVSGSRFDQISEIQVTTQQTATELSATGIQPDIDTSDIPFSEEKKEKIRTEIEALNYRLANVFFLTLNMPDSARVYYNKVIDSGYDKNLVTKSMYSIAEVELLENNYSQAEQWYQQLKERESATNYTNRLAERLDIEHEEEPDPEDTEPDFEYNTLLSSDTLMASEQLVMLSDSVSNESLRPYLLFDVAKNYMRQAKNKPGFDQQIENWFDKQKELDSEREQFTVLQDSARVMIADTSLSDAQKQHWQQIADSTFKEPDLTEFYPFEGAHWDSTRSVLQKIENQYSASKIMPRVQILQKTLEKPFTDTTMANNPVSSDVTRQSQRQSQSRDTAENSRCEDLNIRIDTDGGMEGFMNSLEYPAWTDDVSIRGELEYLLVIEPDGTVQSYEQLSRMDRSGIPQAVESGIENNLKFSPPGGDEAVECVAVFPFNL